jgi:hypothetical protein
MFDLGALSSARVRLPCAPKRALQSNSAPLVAHKRADKHAKLAHDELADKKRAVQQPHVAGISQIDSKATFQRVEDDLPEG